MLSLSDRLKTFKLWLMESPAHKDAYGRKPKKWSPGQCCYTLQIVTNGKSVLSLKMAEFIRHQAKAINIINNHFISDAEMVLLLMIKYKK